MVPPPKEAGSHPHFLQIEPLPGASLSSEDLCQIDSAPHGGRLRRPGFLYSPMRLFWNLRHQGVIQTFRTMFKPVAAIAGARLGVTAPPRLTPKLPDAVLDLQPGEVVEVKQFEEILQTLDGRGRCYGLVFTPEMKKHCGRRYRVFKRLELMFDEYRHTQRRLKNTVLLENVHCTGEGIGCDRACFLYWREVWLRRVEQN
ncbi:MAG: hypothetical protein JOY62_19425 [Acidobacteriaceae bacterium]|nr:hypothetical protein [Acidobacteriaceae bacterium]